jgi:Cation transporter/ATPase, N-terminus
MEQSYTKSNQEVLKHFNVKEAKGLSRRQVEDNRQRYGRNCKHRRNHLHANRN